MTSPASGAAAALLHIESIAKLIWSHLAPKHHELWEDEPHKAEYLLLAESILDYLEYRRAAVPAAVESADAAKHARVLIEIAEPVSKINAAWKTKSDVEAAVQWLRSIACPAPEAQATAERMKGDSDES